ITVDPLVADPVREAGRDEAARQMLPAAHPNPPSVELRAFSARRGKDFLPQRVVDDRMLQLAAIGDRDGYREDRESVHVVRRAVERIDDPRILVLADRAALLGEDRVIGVVILDDPDEGFLGKQLDLRAVVVPALIRDLQGVELVPLANHHFAGAPGCADTDVDHTVHNGGAAYNSRPSVTIRV